MHLKITSLFLTKVFICVQSSFLQVKGLDFGIFEFIFCE